MDNLRRVATVSTSTKLPAFERFIAYRRFGAGLAFTRDGAHVLFVSNMSGQFNLWRVPVDGGWPDQLTAFTEQTVRQVAVSPRDGTIVVAADRDGDEFHQLYLLDPAEGWPEQITDEPEVQHFVGSGAFSPDGTKLAYSAQRPHAEPTSRCGSATWSRATRAACSARGCSPSPPTGRLTARSCLRSTSATTATRRFT